ncbi:SpoIIE family protein phosphatase [Marinimicrobium sp. ABcell2]|uniref:SpoIIE family protein phosphatase n=1 Tax=Marinimicrobium sp. ABcell2 TaxID=3069751 RepID=UPI0027B2B85F|nr:SpoIIE family protein phosphatase [Marinimicrobium sp. ABcell2]MDQ2077921.1 SpoIIE family protein phosphatase [Marinimicrobium sp. ABcell2]
MTDESRKLLIIDDDAPVRQSIVAYLEDSGFDVLEAVDGPSGLEAFRDHLPELVITDLRMPGFDGLQVLKAIHEQAPDTPVVVVSGAGVMGDVVSALRLGASDYLIKPIVDMEVLVHSVRKALERRDLLLQNQRYRDKLEYANRGLKENLRVLERDQLAGRQVQQRLMPKPLATPEGYHAAHHIAPSLYLSGDFVDYAYLNQRYLAFYLADVSGHGASSAFVTIWLKHLVSRMVREEGLFGDQQSFEHGTNIMLQRINEELNETRLNHHLTFFVGVVDTHTQQMRYVVAGHLPMPILVTSQGAEFLAGSGKPVGIFSDVEWQVHSRTLPDAFSLVCFSDGVLELISAKSLQEKETRLLELVAQNSASLDSVCNVLGIRDVSDTPDDIAVLTIVKR